MLTLFALALLPQPVDLDTLTLERARHLSGRVVVATFISRYDAHTDADLGVTVLAARTRDDSAARSAILRGVRLNFKRGQRVRVVGVLEVIDHPVEFVGGLPAPAWSEIRVRESR